MHINFEDQRVRWGAVALLTGVLVAVTFFITHQYNVYIASLERSVDEKIYVSEKTETDAETIEELLMALKNQAENIPSSKESIEEQLAKLAAEAPDNQEKITPESIQEQLQKLQQ